MITATTDFAALAQEVGGDKIDVESIAKGYQDPHFVEAKPSFLLKLRHADLLVVVGLDLEIGWLPPLITQSGNPKIQPASAGYLPPRRTVPDEFAALEDPACLSHAGEPAALRRAGADPRAHDEHRAPP